MARRLSVEREILIGSAPAGILRAKLALLMRTRFGKGKPKAAHERPIDLAFASLGLTELLGAVWS
ncbi:MAG: hypothetical protein DMG57_38765, partial [Acidobacteria bacterium]